MPGPSEDVPRWQPPAESSRDVPRWEPPAPSREVPRRPAPPARSENVTWEPATDVPRWDPMADVPRWQPGAGGGAVGARVEGGDVERRARVKAVSPFALPFVWWRAHPWVFAWAAVFLTPAGVLLLRVVDEYGYERVVAPLQWTLLALLAVLLLRGVLFSAQRSVMRMAVGLVAAVAAVAVLLWPLTRVTLGRIICPARAGTDLGVQSAAVAVDAWQRGETGAAAWHNAAPDPVWAEKAKTIGLLDYRLVESGCFERVAPIDVSRTWHDFRVTIKEGDRAALSKIVVVSTVAESGGWKITSIEGPLP